jgi:hypothetical protein
VIPAIKIFASFLSRPQNEHTIGPTFAIVIKFGM